ncbi:hypothetical protein IWW48_000041 [Coemansia sp. RSA 1200]|nr:hypothetical protein IWW48_000041 [Coemansia sp. RSA 1200]
MANITRAGNGLSQVAGDDPKTVDASESQAKSSVRPAKSAAIAEIAAQDAKKASLNENSTLSRAKTIASGVIDGARKQNSNSSVSTRSSVYEAFGGVESGKTPFTLPINDTNGAKFLAQYYEQYMKDSTGIRPNGTPRRMASPPPMPKSNSIPTGVAPSVLSRMLMNQALDEPQTYVFIFTNPRSGNQQGRNLMDMALRNFRLRDRPEVQVQIYDVTDKTSQGEGLHYLHQLQLRQGDRLLKTAFPELFVDFACGKQRVRPSPRMSSSCNVEQFPLFGEALAADDKQKAVPVDRVAEKSNSEAWEEWITEAASQLQSGLESFSEEEITERLERAQESAIKLHVWSAGGDGTVSSTLEAMMEYGIDVGRLYFSCIPFGTGNDFSDALGWGRSVPGNAVGESMRQLNKIITERLDGYTCKLDIYEITFTTYDDGHIKHVEKNMFEKPGMKRHKCLMIDYFSLGVQGFVGSSFELHRPGKRSLNILMYTVAAAKWVFLKKFPPVNEALESISTVPDHIKNDPNMTDADRAKWLETASEAERRQVLLARVAGPRKRSGGRKMTWTKEPKARHTATARDFGEGVDENVPVIQSKPIEIDVQNVARFWGRNIDVWNNAEEAGPCKTLSNTNGVTDRGTWTPQYAGDGKLELFGVRNIGDYALNQMPGRNTYRIDRLAQMGSPLVLHFRHPQDYPPRSRNPLTDHKTIEQGLLYSMCDGEFIEMYHPRDVIISRKVTLKAVGRSPETSRIVLDTIKNDGLDAVQMDATAAASKTHAGESASVSNYVSSPFMRIFRLGRNSRVSAVGGSADNIDKLSNSQDGPGTGSVLEVSSPVLAGSETGNNGGGLSRVLSQSSSTKRSALSSLRNSLLRTVGRSRSSGNGLGSNSSNGSSRTSVSTVDSSEVSNASANQALPSATKNHHNRLSTIHERSPLKVRQSLSDLRLDSTSPPSTDNNNSTNSDKSQGSHNLAVPRSNPVHTARSKSLDIRRNNPNNNSIVDSLLSPSKVAATSNGSKANNDGVVQSPLYSSSTHSTASAAGEGEEEEDQDVTSTSGISDSSSESHTVQNTIGSKASVIKGSNQTGAQESFKPLSLQHCLMTLGKDLVDSVEVFTSPDLLLSPTSKTD